MEGGCSFFGWRDSGLVFLSYSNLIETKISQIPLAKMVRGAADWQTLLPVGASLAFCLGYLLLILILTGITALTRPIWLLAIYSLLLPLPLLLKGGTTKNNLIIAGLFGISLLYHLAGTTKEIHSRIKFSASLLSKGRSIVALILLVVLVLSICRGGAKLISNEGPAIQEALEEKAAELIDKHVPKLIDNLFSSERVTELSKGLPAEADIHKLQREMLAHLPKGTEIVDTVKKQTPQVIELMQTEFQKTKKAILKAPLISFQNLYLLGSLWSLLGAGAVFLTVVKAFSTIAGLLTGLAIQFLILIKVITKVEEKVALTRLSL